MVTNFSTKANYHRSYGRLAVDRLFSIKQELLAEAETEKNQQKKLYLFSQAALRDTKARELWDKVCKEAEELVDNTTTDKEVIDYIQQNYYPVGIKSINMNWWKLWLSNF